MTATTDFDLLMQSSDPAVVIATVCDGDSRDGCLIGFHTQAGIDPLRVCLWFSRANKTYGTMLKSPYVGIHFPTTDDYDLAALFGGTSGDTADKFAECALDPNSTDVPLLTRCPNRIIARKLLVLDDGADHVCVITEPIQSQSTGPFVPLRVSDLRAVTPGHEADDSR